MLTFCFWQAALKLQKRNKRARDAAIVKEVKKVTPKSFTGLLPAGVKENVIAVEAFMRARDLDFKDGTDMKEITRDGTFPIPCIYCGHVGAMGGQPFRQRLADAARAAGDDGGAAFEVEDLRIVRNAGHDLSP